MAIVPDEDREMNTYIVCGEAGCWEQITANSVHEAIKKCSFAVIQYVFEIEDDRS